MTKKNGHYYVSNDEIVNQLNVIFHATEFYTICCIQRCLSINMNKSKHTLTRSLAHPFAHNIIRQRQKRPSDTLMHTGDSIESTSPKE